MTSPTHTRRALVAFAASAAPLPPGTRRFRSLRRPASAGHSGYGDFARLSYQKAVTVRVLKGLFERGDTRVVDRYVCPDLIQHNPLAPDGAEALKNLGSDLHQQFPDAKYDIKRVIFEGDLVLVHSNVVMTPGERGKAVFDIFRFQGGKIAEQWNVAQDVPKTSVNGNDMFSTESWPRTEQPGPAWLTEYNKKVVTKAFDELMVHKDLSAIDRYYGPEYDQHNPTVPDGVEGAKAGLGGLFAALPQLEVSRKRVIAQGDLVAIHQHFVEAPGARGQAIVNLFRVRNGKIVEHWDVTQAVPETSANDNTMF